MYTNPKLQQRKTNVIEEEIIMLEPIAQIQAILDYVGYNTYLIPKGDENKIDNLYVSFKTDEDIETDDLNINNINDDDEWSEDDLDSQELPLINLMFLNDISKESNDDLENDTYTLQFFISINNDNENVELDKLYEQFNNINHFLPIGHFGWKKEDGLYYKYCLMLKDKNIDSILLIETIELITFIFNKFSVDLINILNNKEIQGTIKLFS
jgi:hypothetical protein